MPPLLLAAAAAFVEFTFFRFCYSMFNTSNCHLLASISICSSSTKHTYSARLVYAITYRHFSLLQSRIGCLWIGVEQGMPAGMCATNGKMITGSISSSLAMVLHLTSFSSPSSPLTVYCNVLALKHTYIHVWMDMHAVDMGHIAVLPKWHQVWNSLTICVCVYKNVSLVSEYVNECMSVGRLFAQPLGQCIFNGLELLLPI